MARSLSSLQPDEIREAVLAEVRQRKRYVEQDYEFTAAIAGLLNAVNPHSGAVQPDLADRTSWDRFFGQVRRALDWQAAQGNILKTPANHRGPDGIMSRYTRYWSRAAWQETDDARKARETADRELASQWGIIEARLALLGIDMDPQHQLDPASWDKLISMAERSE